VRQVHWVFFDNKYQRSDSLYDGHTAVNTGRYYRHTVIVDGRRRTTVKKSPPSKDWRKIYSVINALWAGFKQRKKQA